MEVVKVAVVAVDFQYRLLAFLFSKKKILIQISNGRRFNG